MCWMSQKEFTITIEVDAEKVSQDQKLVNIDCLIVNKFSNDDEI